MEKGPEFDKREPLTGVDFRYGDTSFEIADFERLIRLEGGKPEYLLDIRLFDHPVRSISIVARKTDDLDMFLPTYTAKIGLNPEIVDTAWIDECFQNYLGGEDRLQAATEGAFGVEKTASQNVLIYSAVTSGSKFNLAFELTDEGPNLLVTNGDIIPVDDSDEIHRGVPMLKTELADEILFEDFLEAFSYVMHQTPLFVYERHFSGMFEKSAPNFYALQAGPRDFPVIARDGQPLRHYSLWPKKIFPAVMREMFGLAEFIDYRQIDEIQDKLAMARDYDAARDLNARRGELIVDNMKSLDEMPGLRKSVRGELNTLAALYVNPGFSNMQLERGVILHGKDEEWHQEIADVFAASIGAEFKTVDLSDLFENCSFKTAVSITNFFQSAGIIPKNKIGRQKQPDAENPEERLVLYIKGLEDGFSTARQDRQRARNLASALADSMSRSPGLVVFASTASRRELPLSLVENDVFGNIIKIKRPGATQRAELLAAFFAEMMAEDAVAEANRVYDLAMIDIDYLVRETKGLYPSEIKEVLAAAEISKYKERKRGGGTDPITPADIVRAIGEIDS